MLGFSRTLLLAATSNSIFTIHSYNLDLLCNQTHLLGGFPRLHFTVTIRMGFQSLMDYRRLIHTVPKLGKLLVLFFFLLNIRSWPLVWHRKWQMSFRLFLFHIYSRSQVRVFRDVFSYRIRHSLIRARMLFLSPIAGLKLEDDWLNSIYPIGAHPFDMVVRYRSWASE